MLPGSTMILLYCFLLLHFCCCWDVVYCSCFLPVIVVPGMGSALAMRVANNHVKIRLGRQASVNRRSEQEKEEPSAAVPPSSPHPQQEQVLAPRISLVGSPTTTTVLSETKLRSNSGHGSPPGSPLKPVLLLGSPRPPPCLP